MHLLFPSAQTCVGVVLRQGGSSRARGSALVAMGGHEECFIKNQRPMDRNSPPGEVMEEFIERFPWQTGQQAGKQSTSGRVLRDTKLRKSRRNQILTLVGDKETACD